MQLIRTGIKINFPGGAAQHGVSGDTDTWTMNNVWVDGTQKEGSAEIPDH